MRPCLVPKERLVTTRRSRTGKKEHRQIGNENATSPFGGCVARAI